MSAASQNDVFVRKRPRRTVRSVRARLAMGFARFALRANGANGTDGGSYSLNKRYVRAGGRAGRAGDPHVLKRGFTSPSARTSMTRSLPGDPAADAEHQCRGGRSSEEERRRGT